MLEYYRGNRLIVKHFDSDDEAYDYIQDHLIYEYYFKGVYYLWD